MIGVPVEDAAEHQAIPTEDGGTVAVPPREAFPGGERGGDFARGPVEESQTDGVRTSELQAEFSLDLRPIAAAGLLQRLACSR